MDRVNLALDKFKEDHPEWGCKMSFSSHPPEIVFRVYLRAELLNPQRSTLSDPSSARRLKSTEMNVPAEFMAKVAGAMQVRRRRVRGEEDYLCYQLRVDYNKYPLRSQVLT